jgi:hypothetical protein
MAALVFKLDVDELAKNCINPPLFFVLIAGSLLSSFWLFSRSRKFSKHVEKRF